MIKGLNFFCLIYDINWPIQLECLYTQAYNHKMGR